MARPFASQPLNQTLLAESVSVDGSEDAPALVLVHGVHLGRYSWQPHVRLLRDSFRVITLDLPRHGTLFDVALTQENVDAQLHYVVAQVAGSPPVLAGYSLGGYAIAQFAHHSPQKTRGLVLAGSSLDLTGWRQRAYGLLTHAQALVPAAVFESISRAFFRATLKQELAEAIIRNAFNPLAIAEQYEMLAGHAFSTMLKDYPYPALIVNGQCDPLFRPQSGRFACAPQARSRIVQGGDHVFPLRRPQEFCAILREFCAGVTWSPPPVRK